jgi:hypothetical protein
MGSSNDCYASEGIPPPPHYVPKGSFGLSNQNPANSSDDKYLHTPTMRKNAGDQCTEYTTFRSCQDF